MRTEIKTKATCLGSFTSEIFIAWGKNLPQRRNFHTGKSNIAKKSVEEMGTKKQKHILLELPGGFPP